MEFSEFCNQLIEKTDIVNLVSRYATVKRAGKHFFACCPFHGERTPSFSIDPDARLYYCFGCHKGGNAITFLKEIENIDSIDAIKILAKEAHMELPEFKGGAGKVPDKEKQARLAALLKEAARHYHENLSTPAAEKAREYIAKRNVPDNIVTRFGLGYSVSGEEMIGYLKTKGYTETEMQEAGLAEKKVSGRGAYYYDVYYGRLMFPIINGFGEVIGFGGRVLEKTEMAKYRNTSATVLFDKSKTIYGINLLKKKKQQERKIDSVIMCEGYMDVISLHKAGFDTAVASMGTSLTPQQARMLKNFSENVIISYDGDAAGQKANLRGLDILDECGLNVRVADLPEGLDPDDVINRYGADGYKKCLQNAMTLTGFKLKTIKKSYDLSDPDSRAKYAKEACGCIARLKDPVKIDEYLKIVARETGYEMGVLRKQAGMSIPEEKNEASAPPPEELPEEIRFLLLAYIKNRTYVNVEDIEKFCNDEFSKAVFGSVSESRIKGIGDCTPLVYNDIPEEMNTRLAVLLEYDISKNDSKEYYDRTVRGLVLKNLEKEQGELNRKYNEAVNQEEKKKILAEMNENTKKIRTLKHVDKEIPNG